MAVSPAVPIAIAVRALIDSGRRTSHSDWSRWRWVKPPQYRSPTMKLVEMTSSPTAHFGESLAITVPVRSMPGTIG